MSSKKSSLDGFLRSLDIFDERPTLTVDGHDSYKTICGGLLSLITFVLVTIYAIHRYDVMYNFGDTNHTSSSVSGELANLEYSNSEIGFNVAFGLSTNYYQALSEKQLEESSKYVEVFAR